MKLIVKETNDTRRYDHDGRVVPGSGDAAACACCGRTIVVHVVAASFDLGQSDRTARKAWLRKSDYAVYGQACTRQMGRITQYDAAKVAPVEW